MAALPVGVQLLGKRFREDTILDAAEVIEARGGALTPRAEAGADTVRDVSRLPPRLVS